MAYPPQPGSPTLTNPDMILPDYDESDSFDPRSQSPMSTWKTPNPSDLNFHLPRQSNFPPVPVNPTTPIIYGNGTMLSDIGEVTEAESTIGRGSRRVSSHYSNCSDDDSPLQPAPKIVQGMAKRAHITNRERRASIDSTSTITTQEHKAQFGEIDDLESVGDSNFQGDDEESMASSFVDDAYHSAIGKGVAPAGDRFSTNSISTRAEQILANAKRRLTVRHSRHGFRGGAGY